MFYVESFLKRPNIIISDLSLLKQNATKYFVSLNDSKEIYKIKNLDLDYLEGAIVLSYNDKFIFTLEEWDMLDQLWYYLIEMTEDYLKSGESSCYFPDQPIEMKIIKINNFQIKFSLSHKQEYIVVNQNEFLNFLLTEAESVFKKLDEYFEINYNQNSDIFQKISNIKFLLEQYK